MILKIKNHIYYIQMEEGNIRRILMYREKLNEFIKIISDTKDSECLKLI